MSAPVARAVLSGITAKGCEASSLLARPGIARDDDDDLWPLAKFTAATEAAAADPGDSLLGLSLGKSFKLNASTA